MTLELRWRTAHPRALAARLGPLFGPGVAAPTTSRARGRSTGPGRLAVAGARVGIVDLAEPGPDRLELVGDAVSSDSSSDDSAAPGRPGVRPSAPRFLGLGWATVDADRSMSEVAARLGLAPETFGPGAGDAWLGASTWLARCGPAVIALLEPSTEGRLAAALARSGEGPCALYLETVAFHLELRSGPFGPESLAFAQAPWGPFVLAVPGAIRRRPGSRGTIGR